MYGETFYGRHTAQQKKQILAKQFSFYHNPQLYSKYLHLTPFITDEDFHFYRLTIK